MTFPGTPAVVKPHYTHLWGTSVTAGVHKSATPANGLSLEYIHLQDVMHIAQLQVCRGWRSKQARLRGKKDLNALREHMRTAASDQPLLPLSPTKNVNYTNYAKSTSKYKDTGSKVTFGPVACADSKKSSDEDYCCAAWAFA